MKKLLPLVYAIVFLFSITSKSLARITVQIGAGSSVSSSTGPTPYGTLFEDGRKQYIISAAELTTAGLSAGNLITSLGFNVVTVGSPSLNGFNIKMDHTTNLDHPGTLLTVGNTVYSSASVSPTGGWNMYNFLSNFIWNGIDNVATA